MKGFIVKLSPRSHSELPVCLSVLIFLVGCGHQNASLSKPLLVWTQTGAESGDHLGYKAAGVGDVTGDGYDDLLVGEPGYAKQRGKAFLYLGSADGLGKQPFWITEGEQAGDGFGSIVGALGDITGNGYTDFFVTAPDYNGKAGPRCGKVYVYKGGAKGPSKKPFWTMEGKTARELFGDCAASVGDVNGDGYPDLLAGAYGFDKFRGKVYLFLGGPKGYSSKPDWTFEGEDPGDWMGYGIGPAGDIRGKGYDDVLLGSKYHSRPIQNAGKVYLFYGSSNGLGAQPDWTRDGETQDSRFGHHLSGAGDINGDGFMDVVIGAPGYDRSRGRAYVFYGSAQGLKEKPSILDGKVTGESFGTDVSSAEYPNGDGCAGVLVGGPGYARIPGSASLFLGSPNGTDTTPNDREIGELNGSNFGWVLGSVGDINGDGIPAWFVCCPEFESGKGKIYVYQNPNPDGISFSVKLCRKSNHTLVGPGGAIGFGKDSLLFILNSKKLKDKVQLQVEIKESGMAFDGQNLITSDLIASGGQLEAKYFKKDRSYRWRARILIKDNDRVSHWYYPVFERFVGGGDFRIL
jgi:hypothetical protein